MRSFLLLLFFILTLASGPNYATNVVLNPFSTGVIQKLYLTNQGIEVHKAAHWRNIVYVAVSNQGVYQLDVWNMQDISQPLKTDSLMFGMAQGSRVPFIPLAIMPFDTLLLVQANQQLYIYQQSDRGKLVLQQTRPLSIDGNEPMQLFHAGTYGSMLQRNPKTNFYEHKLIGLSNPANPAFVFGSDVVLPAPITSMLDGLPLVFNNGMGTQPFTCTMLEPDGSLDIHIDKTWKAKIDATLTGKYSKKPISQIVEAVQSAIETEKIFKSSVSAYLQHTQLDRYNLEQWLLRKHNASADLAEVIALEQLALDDPVSFAVRKMVHSGIYAGLSEEMASQLFKDAFSELLTGLFPLVGATDDYAKVYDKIHAVFSADYTPASAQLALYASEKMFGPLLNNPAYLSWTTDQMIQHISSTDAAQMVEEVLKAVETTVDIGTTIPDYILSTIGLDLDNHLPSCMDWPETMTKFMELMLYHNGADIKHDGLAWFELVKYIAYVNGNDISGELDEIDQGIKDYISGLTKSYTDHIFKSFNISGLHGLSVNESLGQFTSSIPSALFVEDALVNVICSQLYAVGIEPSMKIRDALVLMGVPMRFDINQAANVPQATFGDLLNRFAAMPILHTGYSISVDNTDGNGAAGFADNYQNQILLSKLNASWCMQPAIIEKMDAYVGEVVLQQLENLLGNPVSDLSPVDLIPHAIINQFDLGTIVSEQLYLVFRDLFDTAFGTKSHMPLIDDFKNAFFGNDCVAQWKLFIQSLKMVSAIDPTSVSAVMSAAMDIAFDRAYSLTFETFLKTVVGEVIDQVNGDCAGDWRSWPVRINYKAVEIPMPQMETIYGNLFDVLISEHRMIAIYVKRTEDFTNNRLVTLLVYDGINSLQPQQRVYDLGKWKTLDFAKADHRFLWLSGDVLLPGSAGFNDGCALLVDLLNEQASVSYLIEKSANAAFLSAAKDFSLALNGQYFMVSTPTSIFFLPNTFDMKLEPLQYTGAVYVAANNIQLLPNPSTGKILLKGAGTDALVEVFDSMGVKVLSVKGNSTDVGHLPNGVYLVRTLGKCFKLIKK